MKGIEIQLPKENEFSIKTDPDFIKLPCLAVINGKRHSGKTLSVVNYIREMKKRKYCDRCLVITPTYASNKNTWDICGITEEDVLLPSKSVLNQVKKIIQQERDEWDSYVERKKMYKEYQKVIAGASLNISDELLMQKLMLYHEFGFLDEAPKYKYGDRPARLSLIIDDSMGTDIMLPSAGLTKFTIAHRHWGNGMGISVFMLVQSYTGGASQGLARPIREQTTQLWLFKVAQENQLKKIFEESDLEIDYNKFIEICAKVHATQYNFLLIDFNAKEDKLKYRDGFKEFINVFEKKINDK